MNKQLCLINCYLGSLPDYFQIYLDSCSWNPDIDWVIFTDSSVENYIFPPNVKVIPMTLDKVRTLIRERIFSEAKLERIYKLCDYKPTYGLLFSDYIKGYKYWGHCDIDLIWGDMTPILQLLDDTHDRFFSYGHLTIYRNTESANNIFRLPYSGPDYRKVFTSNVSCAFDERSGTWKIGIENDIAQLHKDMMYDIHIPGTQKQLIYNRGVNTAHQGFIIDKGHIIRIYDDGGKICEEERAYLHFQKRKLKEFPSRLYKDKLYQFRYDSIVLLESKDPDTIFENNKDNYPYTLKDFINWWKVVIKYQLFKTASKKGKH